jgi:hypothetical protein
MYLALESPAFGSPRVNAFFARRKTFEKLFDVFRFLIRGQLTQIVAEEKCVGHIEVGELGVKQIVRE